MAGIGFRLRELSDQDGLLAPVASIGHAMVIAAGPWLFTVMALGLVSSLTADMVSPVSLDGFRLAIVYAHAMSLVASAPILLPVARLVGDALHSRKVEHIAPLFVASLAICGGASMLGGLLFSAAVLGARPEASAIVAVTSGLSALIWVAVVFCGAVRDYRGITCGYLLGLGFAVPATLFAAQLDSHWDGMVFGFMLGEVIVLAILVTRVLQTFPYPIADPVSAIASVFDGIVRYRLLAMAGLLSAVGLWIDKLVMWSGPDGVTHEMGLIHAPLYDSAMFVAYLTIMPGLALFVSHIETSFYDGYRNYYASIRNHATLREIEDHADVLRRKTFAEMGQIGFVQGALCLVVLLGAPAVVEAAGLFYQQVGILRLGAVGALFHFLFFSTTSLLLFFDRHRSYFILQATFLVLQAALALITVHLGPTYYGLGYLATCVISSVFALAVLERTMESLTYITFIQANSRRGGSKLPAIWAGRGRWVRHFLQKPE